MKKILTIITTFILTSCSNDNVQLTQEEYKQLIGDTVKPEYPKKIIIYTSLYNNYNDLTGYIFPSSNGHEYLITSLGWHSQNVEHYIECKKCKNDTL